MTRDTLKEWTINSSITLAAAVLEARVLVHDEAPDKANGFPATVEGEAPLTVRRAALVRDRHGDGTPSYELVLS